MSEEKKKEISAAFTGPYFVVASRKCNHTNPLLQFIATNATEAIKYLESIGCESYSSKNITIDSGSHSNGATVFEGFVTGEEVEKAVEAGKFVPTEWHEHSHEEACPNDCTNVYVLFVKTGCVASVWNKLLDL